MQVTEVLALGDYWNDPRFANRRPTATGVPDNFYRPDGRGGLCQVANTIHLPSEKKKDCSGKNVLLSDRFWYFGNGSVPIPNELMHLTHETQGHAVRAHRRSNDVALLRSWLSHWPTGMHGLPIDRRPKADAEHAGGCISARAPQPASPPVARALRRRTHCSAKATDGTPVQMASRKVVFSRKRFDSSYGRMASPILPDGRLVPLPIPTRHDRNTFADVQADPDELAKLLSDLSGGRHSIASTVHLDPDLSRQDQQKPSGWRPALGQSGAAQSHLASQGVGRGSTFLFFGWFRRADLRAGRWRFAAGAPDLHLMFGWLEVEDVLPIVTERQRCMDEHPWIASHPHVANPSHYDSPLNTLYIGARQSRYAPGHTGGGVFPHFRRELQLTEVGASRSCWSLPGWFQPRAGREPLSYHRDASRWQAEGDRCLLRSVAKGQEFVLDPGQYPECEPWMASLIGDTSRA